MFAHRIISVSLSTFSVGLWKINELKFYLSHEVENYSHFRMWFFSKMNCSHFKVLVLQNKSLKYWCYQNAKTNSYFLHSSFMLGNGANGNLLLSKVLSINSFIESGSKRLHENIPSTQLGLVSISTRSINLSSSSNVTQVCLCHGTHIPVPVCHVSRTSQDESPSLHR